jgi:MoxR-like ATPase
MEVSIIQLEEAIKIHLLANEPMMVLGPAGCAKSEVMLQGCKQHAITINKTKFLEWNKVSNATKGMIVKTCQLSERLITDKTDPVTTKNIKDCRNKLKQTYIFADERGSHKDPTDIKGLPAFSKTDYVDWMPDILYRTLSNPYISGTLFFDELPMASDSVQKAMYQVILDNCAGTMSLNPEIRRMAAGNRREDGARVTELDGPLKTRFSIVELQPPNGIDWVRNYAMKNNISNDIINFIQYKPDAIFQQYDASRKDKNSANPRAWVKLNNLLKYIDVKTDSAMIYSLSAMKVGSAIANEFQTFCELRGKINLDDILNDPSKFEDLDIQSQWFTIGLITERASDQLSDIPKIARLLDPKTMDADQTIILAYSLSKDRKVSSRLKKDDNFKRAAREVVEIMGS